MRCWAIANTRLDPVTPARLTALEAAPAAMVTVPLRLNMALPITRKAVPLGLFAETPIPLAPLP